MESLKVGIREFRSQLPHYLLEVGKPLAITRHGEIIGYYIPSRDKAPDGDHTALLSAAKKLDALLRTSGIDIEEIVQEFNTKRRKNKK